MKRNLFRIMLFLSAFLHFSVYAAYYISTIAESPINSENIEQDMEINFEEIPPELIDKTVNPEPSKPKELIEGEQKSLDDPILEDVKTNIVSANGKDKDGYLFPLNGDKAPTPIIDFDLRQFFPKEAKKANITNKVVVVLVQIDEEGNLKSARIVSDMAGYGFDEAAIKIINLARFSPGYVAGKPVKMLHRLPINFTLDE